MEANPIPAPTMQRPSKKLKNNNFKKYRESYGMMSPNGYFSRGTFIECTKVPVINIPCNCAKGLGQNAVLESLSKSLGLHSQRFIFFVIYEWTQ
jgi:hypothetical protein